MELDQDPSGRRRAAQLPVVVLGLHGYGMDERQLETLLSWDGVDRTVLPIYPRAPHPVDPGHGWFPIRIDENNQVSVDPVDVDDAVEHLEFLVDEARGDHPGSPIVVVGYSQGGGLALAALQTIAAKVDAIVVVAGHLPHLPPSQPGTANGLPVLLEYGAFDPIIGPQEREEAIAWARAAGADVTSHVEPAPHVVSTAHRRNIVAAINKLTRQDNGPPGHDRTGNTMHATLDGMTIAQSEDTILIEGNHYFPPESVDTTTLSSSELSTVCPWKGTAAYYDLVVNGRTYADAAWYYPNPSEAASNIQGYVAFGPEVNVDP